MPSYNDAKCLKMNANAASRLTVNRRRQMSSKQSAAQDISQPLSGRSSHRAFHLLQRAPPPLLAEQSASWQHARSRPEQTYFKRIGMITLAAGY